MAPRKATIDWDGYDLLVKFDYDERALHALQEAVPLQYRKWDKSERVWRISPIYLEKVCDVLDRYEYAVRDYTGDDPKAKERQAWYIAKAETARANEDAQARQAREHEERREQEAARRAEQQRSKSQWRHQQTADESWRDRNAGNWESSTGKRAEYEYDYWHASFFITWPECKESHFDFWWKIFLKEGRDKANEQFSRFYTEELRRARSRQRAYDWFESARSRQAPPPPPPRSTIDHYRVLGIVTTCTYAEAKAAYKQQALIHHPDRGGKLEDMVKLNNAWDTIRAERAWT